MSADDNKAISRKFLEAGWKKRDWTAQAGLVSANHLNHGPFTEQMPQGPAGDRAFVETFATAFPDVAYRIDQQEADGDLVKTWVTYTGTQTGQLMNIPPTGKRATVQVLITDRIENGNIAESWAEWDVNDFMRQLGVG